MNRVKEEPALRPPPELAETAQAAVWKGDFRREYTDRNTFDSAALDELYRKNYGITRRVINERSLGDIAKEASFLEVGCNTGNPLLLLQEMDYSNFCGVELQPYAIEIAAAASAGRFAEVEFGSRCSACGFLVRRCLYIWGTDSYFSPRSSAGARRNRSLQQDLHLGIRVLRARRD